MNTWRRVPNKPALRRFIECYWYLEAAGEPDATQRVSPLLPPSPLSHYVLTPATQPFRYVAGQDVFEGYGSHLLFANRQTLRLEETYPLQRLGIAFKAGTLYAWLGLSGGAADPIGTADVTDYPDLALVDGSSSIDLGAQPESAVEHLDSVLSRAMAVARQDEYFLLARRAMAYLDAWYGHDHAEEALHSHAQLAAQLGCSKRTLERAMSRTTGITLSEYRAMLKFNNLFAYAYRHARQPLDWSALAQTFGFSDQSHLIRQLKQRIGSTPGEYLKRRNVLIDVYGDFE
ncbi:hypothetical protein CAI21_09485 [Alkalilimnicola ehrlichii]|uniref:HTH araC/xylS-type domain-containing protein n=1 Tax=Alkalilimnicola ehrlichii TaxID=351052 RepID=A0A3E0WXU5_9GAMM|nr:helix-turn-helix domain-containing protein [Alkalilimnicola ehrlichii]RFA29302.1 hypothetical protein CAI21_09485 [Alkalilimnicola ehrlichii]RFA36815.1 hypothetical protein CAL65_09820 [Alkalilimnicola ehrlichii]